MKGYHTRVRVIGTEEIPVAALIRFPGNARQHADAELRASVQRLGQYRPLVVRKVGDELVILAGNGTADALAATGHDTARAEVIECDDDEARRINLADNRISDLASDDKDALAELLSYLDNDYLGTGWTEADVAKLIEPPDIGGDADIDDINVSYGIVIDCSSEEEQLRLLERLGAEGLSCRALMT